MKAVLPVMITISFIASFTTAQAQDSSEKSAVGNAAQSSVQAQTNFFPRGGWDGNNLSVSTIRTHLLNQSNFFPQGGWDRNDLRVSTTRTRLLTATQK